MSASHQFRVRPWSAIEMVEQQTSVGANGIGAFRFMTKEQVNIWNGVYDEVLKSMNNLPKYWSDEVMREFAKHGCSWKWTAPGVAVTKQLFGGMLTRELTDGILVS